MTTLIMFLFIEWFLFNLTNSRVTKTLNAFIKFLMLTFIYTVHVDYFHIQLQLTFQTHFFWLFKTNFKLMFINI